MSTRDLLSISAGPNHPQRVVGFFPAGTENAALVRSTTRLVRALSGLLARSAEVDAHSQMLASEKAARKDSMGADAVREVRAAMTTLAAERQRTETRAATASAVKPSSSLPQYTVAEDLALAQRFASMSIGERTRLTAEAIRDPAANLRWSEVLQRVAPELTGVDLKMREQLRQATLEMFAPELAATIAAEKEMIEVAQRAADIGQQVLGETFVGALTKLREAPPEPQPAPAAAAATDYEVPDWLRADLESGGGLRRPSRVELLAAAAAAGARAAA